MNQSSTYDDKTLLLQVSQGNELAFQELFNAWSSRLYHFTLGLTKTHELAEDIVQDTFLKIWLRRDRLNAVEHFSAYLFRMAQNAVVDSLKRQANEVLILERNISVFTEDPEPDSRLHIKLVKNVLEEAVRKLPAQQQKVWRLRREYGKRIKEIAAEMGISEMTVKGHLNRAQASLRSDLEREFPLEGGILMLILGLLP